MSGRSVGGVVLVVDDDDGFRALLTEILRGAGIDTVEASSGSDALAAVGADPPALAVLDVNLAGGISGYEVCRSLHERFGRDVPVLFVSGERTESFDRVAGFLIGGDDYLTKPFAPDELLARVQALLRRSRPVAPPLGLTSREHEVLRLLAEGLTQRQIAEELVIAPKTVGTHIEHVLTKLDAHSRAQAVAIAYQLQLVPLPA